MAEASGKPPVVRITGLSKTFTGQRALVDVDLEVRPGEIHALVGENGSGKSTLIKCLSGYHEPDPGGKLVIGGEQVKLPLTPSGARSLGMAFIHQELGLVPSMSVLENLALGRGYATKFSRIRWRRERSRAEGVLEEFGHDVEPEAMVGDLSPADQTLVAIVRALQDARQGARLLVLDEPTAMLPDNESERLFEALRRLLERGTGILYVSHRLREIYKIANRVTVLRDGRLVHSGNVADVPEAELVRHIVGKELAARSSAPPLPADSPLALKVTNLCGSRLDGVSIELRQGEILGIAGLLGSGRSELARIAAGVQAPRSGSIELHGREVQFSGPRSAIEAGVVLIPEDRKRDGAVGAMSLAHNLTLPTVMTFWNGARIDAGAERRAVDELIGRVDVRPPDPSRRFDRFSGGNQQKAVIAKWLAIEPSVAIFDEPGQGVDVGSKAAISKLICSLAERGCAVLVIDSDLDELVSLSHRVIVMQDGRPKVELQRGGISRAQVLEAILSFSAGTRSEEGKASQGGAGSRDESGDAPAVPQSSSVSPKRS